MHKRQWSIALISVALITACVTINVYFPAAEAQQAAERFIDNVIGDSPESKTVVPAPTERPLGFSVDLALISSARAAADLNIATPAIQAIQTRMAQRFEKTLKQHFDSGALGLRNDGLVELRDASAIALPDRAAAKQAVADENRDRDAVYREIAVANQHPEWEDEIRSTFAKQWIAKAHAGWYFQNAAGEWQKK